MTNIADPEWATQQLDDFISMTTLVDKQLSAGRSGRRHAGDEDQITAQAVIVERIFAHLDPEWRGNLEESLSPDRRWTGHRLLAVGAKATIAADSEIRVKLGDNGPQISASALHPWAWEGARSLWQSGHFREAVTAAARKINAETQNKLGRRDISEIKLFQDALSTNQPAAGRSKLRIVRDDGGDTFKSVQRGVMAFAEGCFAAIRNPNSHEDGLPELPENEALEQLSAFSLLARWVDGATVETAS